MSLSDKERINGLYYSIHRLSGLRRNLITAKQKNDDQYPLDHYDVVENQLDKLWHCLLAGQSNSMHWFFGSATSNLVQVDDNSPWAVAVQRHMPSLEFEWKLGTPAQWSEDPLADLTGNEKFFDPFDSGFLTITALLQEVKYDGVFLALVFDIYQELETLSYYLRRYCDELLTKLADLDQALSAILGACFSIFCESEEYGKAYVLHNVCKLLYGSINSFDKDKNDVVTRWAVRQCIHHDIPPVMDEWSMKEIAELHLHIVHHEDDLLERLLGLMRLAGKRYYYDHQYKELCNMMKEEAALRKTKARSSIKEQFEACKKAHEESEKEDRKKDTPFAERQLGIYGYWE